MTDDDVATVRRIVGLVWARGRAGLHDDDLTELEGRVLLAIIEQEPIREIRPYAYVVARRQLRRLRQERRRDGETMAVIQFSSLRPGIDHLPLHVEVPSDRSNWGGRRSGAGRPKLQLVGADRKSRSLGCK